MLAGETRACRLGVEKTTHSCRVENYVRVWGGERRQRAGLSALLLRKMTQAPARTLKGMQTTHHAEARLRVRYAETDQMGVVYHANYLVWFEVGRVELMRSAKLDYKRLEEEFHCLIAVVEARVRYRAPARYDDEIVVKTSITALRGSMIKMGYEVLRANDGLLLCEGETTHVVVDRTMTSRLLPETYAEVFRGMLNGTAAPALR